MQIIVGSILNGDKTYYTIQNFQMSTNSPTQVKIFLKLQRV